MLKRALAVLCVISALLGLAGCGSEVTTQDTQGENVYTFTDALGRSVSVRGAVQRVVAVSGSFAQMWVLSGGSLVGTTSDAESERNMDIEGIGLVGTIKEPNLEAIIALEPDFVILNEDTNSHKELSSNLDKMGIVNAFFKVELFEDYMAVMKTMTDITGRADLYEKNAQAVEKQVKAVLDKTQGKQAPVVLLIRAFGTGAKAKGDDNHTGVMLRELGCDNIVTRHDSLLENISMEEVIAEDPDFIFVTTMGDSGKAMEYLRDNVESSAAWSELSAVKNGRYIVLPKELFHYKPNEKWGEAYSYLYDILYEE